jgi:hypothetical protein
LCIAELDKGLEQWKLTWEQPRVEPRTTKPLVDPSTPALNSCCEQGAAQPAKRRRLLAGQLGGGHRDYNPPRLLRARYTHGCLCTACQQYVCDVQQYVGVRLFDTAVRCISEPVPAQDEDSLQRDKRSSWNHGVSNFALVPKCLELVRSCSCNC